MSETEPYDPRRLRTPVPRNVDGSINWRSTVIGALTIVSVLGGGGGVAAWQMNKPDASDESQEMSDLKEANKSLINQIEKTKEERLNAFDRRLGKIENWQLRYGIVIDRMAEESLGADEAKRVRRLAARAAEAAGDEQ